MMILSRAIQVNNKGQAMIEMALVIGFLVVLIFGMTEFGRAMYTKNTLTNAARAGARVAVVTTATSYPSLAATSVNCSSGTSSPSNVIYDAVCRGITGGGGIHAPGMSPPSAVVTIDIKNPGGGTQTAPASGYTITVNVQSNFDPVLALMQNMISAALVGQASMRYE